MKTKLFFALSEHSIKGEKEVPRMRGQAISLPFRGLSVSATNFCPSKVDAREFNFHF